MIEILLYYFINVYLTTFGNLEYVFSYVLLTFLLILFQAIIFEDTLFKSWMTSLIACLFLVSFTGLMNTLILRILSPLMIINPFINMIVTLISQLIYLLFFSFLSIFIRKKIRNIEIIYSKNYLFILIIPVLLQYCIYIFYFNSLTTETLILFLFSFLTIIILALILYKQLQLIEKSSKNRILSNLLDSSRKQFNQMIENEKALQEIRHDLKNHLIIIQSLNNEKNYTELSNYLNKINPIFNKVQPKIYCENIYLNTLLNEKIAEYKNIEFNISISPGYCDNFEDLDLCILVSNLLDNAIEELSKHLDLEQTIHLTMYQKNNFKILAIRNPLSCYKTLQTEKKEAQDHGFGLSIIENIVNKYNGNYTIIQEDYFEVKIVFCL